MNAARGVWTERQSTKITKFQMKFVEALKSNIPTSAHPDAEETFALLNGALDKLKDILLELGADYALSGARFVPGGKVFVTKTKRGPYDGIIDAADFSAPAEIVKVTQGRSGMALLKFASGLTATFRLTFLQKAG
jgi:hypothetical protein